MKKDSLLRVLCASSEAGGEKHSRTYPHSKTGTISIAEGLRALINSIQWRPAITIPKNKILFLGDNQMIKHAEICVGGFSLNTPQDIQMLIGLHVTFPKQTIPPPAI